MDPNANLAAQLRIAARMHDEITPREMLSLCCRLAELVETLNEWIVGGGFLPDAWNYTVAAPNA